MEPGRAHVSIKYMAIHKFDQVYTKDHLHPGCVLHGEAGSEEAVDRVQDDN